MKKMTPAGFVADGLNLLLLDKGLQPLENQGVNGFAVFIHPYAHLRADTLHLMERPCGQIQFYGLLNISKP